MGKKKPGLEGKGAPPTPAPTGAAAAAGRSVSGPPTGWISMAPKPPAPKVNGRSYSSTFKLAADEEQAKQDAAAKAKGFAGASGLHDPKALEGDAWVGVVRTTLNEMFPNMLPDLGPKKPPPPKKEPEKKPPPPKPDMAEYMKAMAAMYNPYGNPYAQNPYASPYAQNPYASPYGGAPTNPYAMPMPGAPGGPPPLPALPGAVAPPAAPAPAPGASGDPKELQAYHLYAGAAAASAHAQQNPQDVMAAYAAFAAGNAYTQFIEGLKK